VLGFRSIQINFEAPTTNVFSIFNETTFKKMYSPIVGMGVRAQSLRNSLFGSAMLTYSYMNVEGSKGINRISGNEYQFKQNYHVPKLYFSVGISPIRNFGLYIYGSGFWGLLIERNPKGMSPLLASATGFNDFNSQTSNAGFALGIGYKIKKISIEANYESSNGVSKYYTLVSDLKILNFLVKYRIQKKDK
jgi:hypothetical protein